MKVILETNEFQTPITDELMSQYPKEVQDEFLDVVNNVEFIRRLISPDRKRAKDLPRDEKGRIIVDIVNPHILEDMDYFRETAICFKKTGRFTTLRPNGNPNSEYYKWLQRETKRCWEGHVRPSDGEWVTGDMYFYLNFMPMELTEKIEGQARAVNRITSTPRVWEGSYLWFHYIHQARYGGLYDQEGGRDALQIATRGAGKAHPYSEHVYTPQGVRLWEDISIGDMVYGDNGRVTEVIGIPFDGETDIYEFTLKDGRKVKSSANHLWKVFKYGKETIVETKDIVNKYYISRKISDRNPSGREYFYQIPVGDAVYFPYKFPTIDPYTFGLLLGDGSFRHPESTLGRLTALPSDMEIYEKYIPYETYQLKRETEWCIKIPNYREYLIEKDLYMKKSSDKYIPSEYIFNSVSVRMDLLKGLIDSDGTVDNKGTYSISTSSSRMANDISIICRSLGINCRISRKDKTGYKKGNEYVQCLPSYNIFIYSDKVLTNLPRKIYKLQAKSTKYSRSKIDRTTIIDVKYVGKEKAKCITVNNSSHCYLINDFIVTHNSFSCASMLAKDFIIGDNAYYKKRVNAFIMASNKDTLSNKDGTLKKFEACIDLNAELMQWPSKRLYSSLDKMVWEMGYIDADTGAKKGTRNGVYGVTTNDDAEKGRGSRGAKIIYEEMGRFPKFQTVWTVNEPSVRDGKDVWGQMIGIGCVCAGTKVYNRDGVLINIEDISKDSGIIGFKDGKANIEPITYIQKECYKECVRINTGLSILECSYDHPILVRHKVKHRVDKHITERRTYSYKLMWKEAGKLSKDDYVANCDVIDVWGNYSLDDAYLVGLLIGDGSYGYDKTPILSNCDDSINSYIESKYDTITEKSYTTKDGRVYKETRIRGICPMLRSIGIYGQTKQDKRLPINFESLDKDSAVNLLAGLYDTDGSIYYSDTSSIGLAQCNRSILEQIQVLLRKLGVISHIYKINPIIREGRKDKNPWYNLQIKDKRSLYNFCSSVPLKVEYKVKAATDIKASIAVPYERQYDNIRLSRVTSVEKIGVKRIYNLTANDSHTYLANNIITHNTGGSEGSNFYGILQMLYNPKGYNVYALPNYFDKNSNGKGDTIFFFGAYLNRGGYYNENGVSDVTATILDILSERYKVKYNSTDPNRLTQVVAERPLTIQEAIMRKESSAFPSAELSDRKNEIDADPSIFDDVYTGRMAIVSGKVDFIPDNVNVIREFPHKDNRLDGGIEIYEMPKTDRNGNVYANRYIAGTDPVDDDNAQQSLSLQSTFILDLWTDNIVAEYTGRPTFADEYYEQLRLLLIFFNAVDNYENNKKGLFAYFQKMSSLNLLSDTLEFLHDKDLVKVEGIGNRSKGFNANKFINQYARQRIRDWLLIPETVQRIINGEAQEVSIHKLRTLKSRALIQELIQWNSLGNYDRVSALGALMLLREHKMIMCRGNINKDETDLTYPGNSDFFKSYEKKMKLKLKAVNLV